MDKIDYESVPTQDIKPESFELTSVKVDKEPKNVELQRELGLFSAVSLILGVIIGSGIFVSPSAALSNSGSVGMCILVWTISGLISLLGALAYAELGTVVPRSGAEYAYFKASFNDLHPYWGPLPAFLCAWVYVLILRPAEVAVITLTFAEYICRPFAENFEINQQTVDNLKLYIGIAAILVITTINLFSVKLYVHIQNIFGVFKIIACMIVIFGGIYAICIGHTENLKTGFEGTKLNPGNIALAFYSGLWAYDGWNAVTTVTEEVQNPSKNIPRSIAISVPLVTFLYVFMNIAYMAVLTITEMEDATAVAVAFGNKILGPVRFFVPVGVALATFGCALSIQFGVTRLCYVASQEGHMIEVLSFINVKRLTPAPAVFLQGLIALAFIMSNDIVELIEFASLLIWMSYGVSMISLLVLRRTKADVPRPYKVPTIIPYFILAVSIFLCVCPIATNPSPKFLFAVGFIVSGIFIYTPFVYYKLKCPCMDRFTKVIKYIFNAEPPTKFENPQK